VSPAQQHTGSQVPHLEHRSKHTQVAKYSQPNSWEQPITRLSARRLTALPAYRPYLHLAMPCSRNVAWADCRDGGRRRLPARLRGRDRERNCRTGQPRRNWGFRAPVRSASDSQRRPAGRSATPPGRLRRAHQRSPPPRRHRARARRMPRSIAPRITQQLPSVGPCTTSHPGPTLAPGRHRLPQRLTSLDVSRS
jgi:hypothetical protein